jgi:2-phospho-L-lactate/phosphoenolpyruvate guanylyltransferase
MRTLAVLPVKRFGAAKQRLGARLDPAQRAALAEAMLFDVLAAARDAPAIESVVVVTAEPRAARLARGAGADVLPDGREAGQSAAATVGIDHAVEGGFERVLLLPGDTPLLTAGDLGPLLDRARATEPEAVVVADRHGTGTNALALSPPTALAPSFGPGSRDRHVAAAGAAGVGWRVERVAALEHDVDTPEDLDALVSALASGEPRRAPRTRAALERAGLTLRGPARAYTATAGAPR